MALSVFDMFKIGIGPSSSHTVGPMRAAQMFVTDLQDQGKLAQVTRVKSELFGSLGATGKGHGSDTAVMMGLLGEAPDLGLVALGGGEFELVVAGVPAGVSVPRERAVPLLLSATRAWAEVRGDAWRIAESGCGEQVIAMTSEATVRSSTPGTAAPSSARRGISSFVAKVGVTLIVTVSARACSCPVASASAAKPRLIPAR